MSSSHRTACIVGGGPAGLAAAITLVRVGYEVVVADCAVPPIDKACGEGLMPDSISALAELGVEIPAGIGFAFKGVRFADSRSSVCADFPNGLGRGVRRTVLHELLIQHVVSLGVSILWKSKHAHLVDDGVSVEGRFVPADIVVGADGQNSTIRREAALHQIRREKRRFGFRRHYQQAPWSSYMELYWGPRSQLYVTPIAPDEVCIAVISRDSKLRLEEALSEVPELRRRLSGALPVSPEMGALSVSRRLRQVQRDNVILVGDASGSVDAITGEGMCLGFKQSLALESALRSGDVRRYQQSHSVLMSRPQMMASLMLALERNHRLRRKSLASLAEHPEIFQSLLAVHVGASSFRDLWSWRLSTFGRTFLTA